MTYPHEPYGIGSGDPKPSHVERLDEHFVHAKERQTAAVLRRHGFVVRSRKYDSHGSGDATIGERHNQTTEKPTRFSYVTDFKTPKNKGESPIIAAFKDASKKGQHHVVLDLRESGSQPGDVYRAIHRRVSNRSAAGEPGKVPETILAPYIDASGREQVKVFNRKTIELIARKSRVPANHMDQIFIKQGERKNTSRQQNARTVKNHQSATTPKARTPVGQENARRTLGSVAPSAHRRSSAPKPVVPSPERVAAATANVAARAANAQPRAQAPTRTGGPRKQSPSAGRVAAAKANLTRRSAGRAQSSLAETSPGNEHGKYSAASQAPRADTPKPAGRPGGPRANAPSESRVKAARAALAVGTGTNAALPQQPQTRKAQSSTPAKPASGAQPQPDHYRKSSIWPGGPRPSPPSEKAVAVAQRSRSASNASATTTSPQQGPHTSSTPKASAPSPQRRAEARASQAARTSGSNSKAKSPPRTAPVATKKATPAQAPGKAQKGPSLSR